MNSRRLFTSLVSGLLALLLLAPSAPRMARAAAPGRSSGPQTAIPFQATPTAAPPAQPELVATLSGNMRQILVNGALAYIGQDDSIAGSLDVYTIGGPPARIGRVALPGNVLSMARSGTMVYVGIRFSASGSEIVVVDVSVPQNPTIRGTYTLAVPYTVGHLLVVGSRLYLGGDPFSSAAIVNVSNPANPTLVGWFGPFGSTILARDGNRVIVGGGGSDPQIFDITNPDHPQQVGTAHGGGSQSQLAGNLLYSIGYDRLLIIDITKPQGQSTVSEYRTLGTSIDLELVGSRIYLLNEEQGLLILDVHNAAMPTLISAYGIPGPFADLTVANGFAYVAGSSGLQVLDVRTVAGASFISGLIFDGPYFSTLTEVRREGAFVYVAEQLDDGLHLVGGRLHIVDLSDPANPVERGMYPSLKSAEGLRVVGGIAYVADHDSLQIIDVSNPAAPRRLGSLPIPAPAWAVEVVGTRAYVAGQGMSIVDVGDPRHPRLLGTALPTGFVNTMDVVGSRAYIASVGSGGLVIVDVSNPAAPVTLGSLATGAEAKSVRVANNFAYVADGALEVIDITNPAAPALAATVRTRDLSLDVQIDGARLLVATGQAGVQILSLTDPRQPTLIGAFEGDVYARRIHALDGRVYIAGGGIVFFADVTTLAPPRFQSKVDQLAQAFGIEIVAGLAYIASGTDGLQIWNVQIPESASRLSRVRPHADADIQGIALSGKLAYLASYQRGLDIVDISDPLAPVLRGTYPTSVGSLGPVMLRAIGNRLYMIDGAALTIFDISSRLQPHKLGSYGPSLGVYDFQVVGTTAYLAGGSGGMKIVNVANAASPALIKSYSTPGIVYGIAVQSGLAYLADGDSHNLLIVNVANPANPTPKGSVQLTDYVARVRVSGTVAYVADGGAIDVVDVSNPAAPALRGSVTTVMLAANLWFDGNLAYAALGIGGLRSFWYRPATKATLGAAGGSLNSAVDKTAYTFPAGSLGAPTNLTHTPRYPGNLPAAGRLAGIGHAFELTALDAGTSQPVTPAQPYTIKITYTPAERGVAIEGALALYAWNNGAWVRLPGSTVNTSAHTVTAATTRTGLFAVFGETRPVFVPLVLR